MSTSRDSCRLRSVKKQKHDFQVFVFVQCIDLFFFDIRNNQGLCKGQGQGLCKGYL